MLISGTQSGLYGREKGKDMGGRQEVISEFQITFANPASRANDRAMIKSMLPVAEAAARLAGDLLRDNYDSPLQVNEALQYDLKLELDVRSQTLISGCLLETFPDHMILGEEGNEGCSPSDFEWIVDPIDGTVNYFYGIPHFAVSIALRHCGEMVLGVIYDPMRDELWSALAEENHALLNGKPTRASGRAKLADSVVTIGFSKSKESLDAGMERYRKIAYEVRKTRMLGSAALALTYIACGRLDAYIEEQINLWDIAAGKLIVEKAGGRVDLTPHENDPNKFSITAWNGLLPLEDAQRT